MNQYFEPALNLMLQNWAIFLIIIILVFIMCWAKVQLHGSIHKEDGESNQYTCTSVRGKYVEMEWLKGCKRSIKEWRKIAIYLTKINVADDNQRKSDIEYFKTIPDYVLPEKIEKQFGIIIKRK